MPFPLLPFSPFQNSNPCIWCRFLNAIHRIGVCPICGKPLERQASEVDENYDPDANQENPEGAAPAGTKRDIEPDNDMVGPESGGGAQENTYAGDAVLPLAKHHNQNDVVNLDSEPHEIDQKSKLQSKLEEPVGDIWKPDEESPERTETNEQERDENDAKGWAYKPTPRWLLVVTGGFIVAIIGVALFLTGVIDFSKPVDSAESDTENESDMVEALVGQIDEITEEIPPVDPASFIIPRETPSITESPEKTDSVPSPKQTQTAEPIQKPSGPRMYTSFAYMVSLDQATGVAEFDYFDMLKGADAVSWLVEMEGYSESAAEKIVAGYSDSEFIEKNTNPALRSVELGQTPIILANGSLASGPGEEVVDYKEFLKQYLKNPNYFMDECFYYIEVDEATGDVELITQIYLP